MLQSKEKVNELRNKLPWGAQKVISERTGLHEKTVSAFFKNGKASFHTTRKIIEVAKEIIDEQSFQTCLEDI